MNDYIRVWQWLCERAAVEIVRLRTGWLGDACRYLADVARGPRGAGRHVLPAGETQDLPGPAGALVITASKWSDEVMPTARADEHAYPLEMAWAAVGRAGELEPLPVQAGNYTSPASHLRKHIDAAWAATGTTEAEFWASQDTLDDLVAEFEATGNLPGPDLQHERDKRAEPIQAGPLRAGEPTNVTMGNWTPRETAVDASLLAAIREHVDGQYTGQVVDRYFSQVSVREIFERECGPLLRRLQAGAA